MSATKGDTQDIDQLYAQALARSSASALDTLLDPLLRAAHDKEQSKYLFEKLLSNPAQFIQVSLDIGDDSGKLIQSVFTQNEPSREAVLNILSALRANIKSLRHNDTAHLESYLGIYFAIISKTKVSNPQHLSLFLSYVGASPRINHRVLLILVQSLQLEKSEAANVASEYLELQMDDSSLDATSFINFLAVLEMCFPLVPEVCAQIYTDNKTKEHILRGKDEFRNSTVPILKCISSSCMIENCRSFTSNAYYEFLTKAFNSGTYHAEILAGLVLAKVWSTVQGTSNQQHRHDLKIADVAGRLMLFIDEQTTKNDQMEYNEYAIEGLSYLSLYWEPRELMRMDVTFMEKLLKVLQGSSSAASNINTSVQYGILTILVNLTKSKQSATTASAREKLKNAASPKVGSESEEEKTANIQLFNAELLKDDRLVSHLCKIKTFESSSTNISNTVVEIVYNLSCDQKKSLRTELVKQGGLTVLLSYLIKHSKMEKVGGANSGAGGSGRVVAAPSDPDKLFLEHRMRALRGVCRMLISVDPKLAFDKYDVKTVVPFLIELLDQNDSMADLNGSMTILDKYEALLALTNIAAAEDPQLQNFIILEVMPCVDDLILSEFQLQIGTYELLNNLISQPILLAKFFNIEQEQNKQRLLISLKLLNSNNVELQTILAKFFVNATNFDMVADVLVDNKLIFDEVLKITTEILHDQNEPDLITASSYLLMNLVYAAANKSENSLAQIRNYPNLRAACAKISHRGNNAESKEIMDVVNKLCKFY
ncbi:uncharacterized protein LODBEIA_P46210 [Lodderomyces beijingensis]|uniref:UNC-45/Cro1/She4 central domain-containing protein n=1 Tax=Lodderomyces beijingensis TaxID=1775926 RepID=A0ABP0ZVB7_9ASCO